MQDTTCPSLIFLYLLPLFSSCIPCFYLMFPITSDSFLYASSLASYFLSPSFVPRWSPINLVYCSHHSTIWHPSLLFSSPPPFPPSFIPYSWHIFLSTHFHPHFITTHSSLILHHFGILCCLSSSSFIFPSFWHTSPLSCNVFISKVGWKYGIVTITREATEISILIWQGCWPSAYYLHMHIILLRTYYLEEVDVGNLCVTCRQCSYCKIVRQWHIFVLSIFPPFCPSLSLLLILPYPWTAFFPSNSLSSCL